MQKVQNYRRQKTEGGVLSNYLQVRNAEGRKRVVISTAQPPEAYVQRNFLIIKEKI